MSQYPNYYQPTNYQNNYQNYQNPYMQQYQNNAMPQFQAAQTIQAQNLQGRLVDDVNSINVNEVPMNGSYAIFPKSDMSEIYCKAWNANGQIQTVKFVPFLDNADNSKAINEKTITEVSEDFTRLFGEVNSRLDKIEKALTPNNRRTDNRKKVDTDE